MPWPLMSCGKPTTAASATAGWLTSARLDLGGAHAVAGDVDDVVDAADDPVVAVLVAAAAVTGEVVAGVLAEVGLVEALRVAVDACASCPASGRSMHSTPSRGVGDLGAVASSRMIGSTPKNGMVAEPGLIGDRARQRGDQDAAGLGLPPGVDDRAAPLPMIS